MPIRLRVINMNHSPGKILLSFLLLMLLNGQVNAGEIARDIRSGTGPDFPQPDGGYADLGFGLEASSGLKLKGDARGPVNFAVHLNMGYQWRGFFVEALSDSEKGLVFGYNALNTQNWTLDVVLGPEHNEITGELYDELKPLRDRYVDLTAGIRATGYFGHNIIQLQLRNEILTGLHEGYSATLNAGRSWQIRNANLHALVGFHHGSQQVTDYYLGVSEREASAEFPQYTAGASNSFSSEIGLTYPLNESWILRSKITAIRFDEDIANSPLMENTKRNFIFSVVTANYVF